MPYLSVILEAGDVSELQTDPDVVTNSRLAHEIIRSVVPAVPKAGEAIVQIGAIVTQHVLIVRTSPFSGPVGATDLVSTSHNSSGNPDQKHKMCHFYLHFVELERYYSINTVSVAELQ